jgi:molybdopterin converting factor small subunit
MYVEFFGIPRERVGISELQVHANTLGELFGTLATRLPAFNELLTPNGLHPSIAANLNGGEFVSDPHTILTEDDHTILTEDDHLLILSADAGG